MALQFSGIEAVSFGDIVEVPQIDNSIRIRLGEAMKQVNTENGMNTMIDLVVSCFPNNRERVREFINKQMTTLDLEILVTYLTSGQRGVDMIERRLDKAVDSSIEGAE